MTHDLASLSAARTCRFFFLGAILLASTPSGGAMADDLRVEVRGFTDDIGQAVVELYASAHSYRAGVPDELLMAPIVARVAAATVREIDGTYAIRAFHDRNSSNALETLLRGIALEPAGFSQGAWREFARPGWELASFSSDIEPPVQMIRLRTHAVVAFAQMLAVGLPSLLAVFMGLAAVRWVRGSRHSSTETGETCHD